MKRFPVGAATTQSLLSFCQREEEAPRHIQGASLMLCAILALIAAGCFLRTSP
jgi:hypothetical protein